MENAGRQGTVKPLLGAFSALALWAAKRLGAGEPAWSRDLSAFFVSFAKAKSRLAKLGLQAPEDVRLSYANAGALGWQAAAADAALAPFIRLAADMFFEKLEPCEGDAVAVAVYGPGAGDLFAGEEGFPERFCFIKKRAAP